MIGEAWMKWTFFEAVSKTASKVLQKLIGTTSVVFSQLVFVNAVVGAVQVFCSFIALKSRRNSIFGTRSQMLGACAFGLSACIYGFLAFSVFWYDGEMTLNTFIATFAIVPGALLDRLIFRDKKIGGRKWLAFAVFGLAGYAVLGFPSFAKVAKFPLWVWLSFISMFLLAINEVISRSIKDIQPMVKNFWGGLVTLIGSLLVLVYLGKLNVLADFHSDIIKRLWIFAIIGGLIVVAMWVFKVRSYKGGATIAIKRLVMDGSYLMMVMIIDVCYFSKSMTWGKAVGVILYFPAFTLMDDGTWKYVSGWFRRERSMPAVDIPAKVPTRV